MKDNRGDIEKLFSDSFENFEGEVDPSIWNNISSQIGAQQPVQDPSSISSGASSSGSSFMGVGAAKIAAVVGTAGLLTVGGYYMFSSEEEKAPMKEIQPKMEMVIETGPALDAGPSNNEVSENQAAVEGSIDQHENNPVQDEVKAEPAIETTVIKDEETSNHQAGDQVVSTNAEPAKLEEEKKEKTNDPKVVATDHESPKEMPISPEEEIKQRDLFEASIYASVKSGKQPLEVVFENIGTQSDKMTWYFDDGSTSNSAREVHTFDNSGEHLVVLMIQHEDGRISKDSTRINVAGSAYVKANDVFTPNNDGINDAFLVEADNISSIKIMVFDIKQRLVYQSNSQYGHWNGMYMNKGEELPKGVYFYVIEATDLQGNALKPTKGTVQLFR